MPYYVVYEVNYYVPVEYITYNYVYVPYYVYYNQYYLVYVLEIIPEDLVYYDYQIIPEYEAI